MKEMVFNLLVVSVMGTICFFCFVFLKLFLEEKFQNQKKELTTPTIKLEINNNKVDTIYIYIVK